MAPKNQPEEVLVITYYYQKYRNLEQLTLEHYYEAYNLLQLISVDNLLISRALFVMLWIERPISKMRLAVPTC